MSSARSGENSQFVSCNYQSIYLYHYDESEEIISTHNITKILLITSLLHTTNILLFALKLFIRAYNSILSARFTMYPATKNGNKILQYVSMPINVQYV